MSVFSRRPDPNFQHGEETDILPSPVVYTHTGAYKVVQVLPGESLADFCKRVYGANTEANRNRILANNGLIKGKVIVPNV